MTTCLICAAPFDEGTSYLGQRINGTRRRYCSRDCRRRAHNARCRAYDHVDVDEIAAERAARGDLTVSLTGPEVARAWAICEGWGMSSRQIGERLGISPRSIVRWRGGHNQPVSRPGRSAA